MRSSHEGGGEYGLNYLVIFRDPVPENVKKNKQKQDFLSWFLNLISRSKLI